MKFRLGSAKHHGDGHKPTAWRARGRGRVFDGLNERFSRHSIRYATLTELSLINEVMPSGRVLDLGCGTGRVLIPLTAQGAHDAIGLDLSLAMLQALHAKAEAQAVAVSTVNAGGNANLPFAEAAFDGAYSFGMISHYVEWTGLLANLAPQLKAGAPVLFDLAIVDNGNDGFAKATSPALGGFAPDMLDRQLADTGFVLDRIVPQRFGSSADITASWLDHKTMTETTFGEMHTVVERVFERLLADDDCKRYAIVLDEHLRRLLAYRAEPSYRPAASQMLIVRRGETIATEGSGKALPCSDAERAAALRELLSGPVFADAERSESFMRYLCVLEPFLRQVCGGATVVEEAFPRSFARFAETTGGRIRDMAERHRERAIRVRTFRAYRRGVRRWLELRSRFA